MNTRQFLKLAPICSLFLLPLALVSPALADTAIWTGAGPDQNWSTGANWTNATAGTFGAVPGSTDDLQFFDSGALSPTVDGAFAGTVSSLHFGSTNGDYITAIPAGKTLNVTGAGGLRVGTPGDTGTVIARTATFTGSGARLNLNNPAANLVLNQGTATAVNGSRAILDLQGLDTFTANLNGIGLGSVSYANSVAQRNSGTLYLAKTNIITLNYALPLSSYVTNGAVTNALEMVNVRSGNPPVALSILYLGQTNAIFVDSIGVGRAKASTTSGAIMMFNPALIGSSPVAYFRGLGGASSRVTWWSIGDMANDASSAQHSVGTNDFRDGIVDALVETMSLGRDCGPNHTASGSGRINTGVLIFDNGKINVNTLIVGNQSLAAPGSTSVTPNAGYVTVLTNATLIVNSNLALASTSTQTHTGAQQTHGRVTIDGGTLLANNITIGPSTVTNAILTVTNSGTIILSNTLASASKPLAFLRLSDANFVVHLTGAPTVAYVTNLYTGGSGNNLVIGSSVVFPSYPAQVALFKYVNLQGSGNNFTLGSVPANVAGASLSNNTFNSSIDIYIPSDPRPVITNQPAGFSSSPGANLTLNVKAAGIPPFTYQWRRDGTNITDAGNVAGTTTDTLSINNAQSANNGDYSVVVANAYGSATSSPPAVVTISAQPVPPHLGGPSDQAVIQGNDATLTASVSGTPVPFIQWRKNGLDISGANTASYTISNAQYPADEATYSIVATNIAGKATNSAFLTVIVPPGITTQPVSVTVPEGSPASFTVVATGHPSPSYLWNKNNNAISTATNATLSFPAVTPGDAANYAALVSNAGGSTNSATVALIVTTTNLVLTNLTPANGATGVCYDTPLYLKFNTTPILGSGTLRIYDSTDTLVDTIDLTQNQANNAQSRTIGGGTYYAYPVIIHSNSAAVFPHLDLLASNTTYYVLMDAGFFKDAGGASLPALTNSASWRFTTKVAGPDPAAVTNIVVAGDGSGDFATVQGVIDWVPAGNVTPINILLRKGTYEEIIRIPAGKNNLTFTGEGRQESVLAYANNNNFQAENAHTQTRCLFYANGNDLVFRNLTLTNSAPQGGSQAETFHINGMRNVIDNCRLCSFQDTLLINTANISSAFVNKCLIQGDVDFIWGSGIGFFDNCEIRAMARANNAQGINTQARTGAGVYGLIFLNCALTRSDSSMTNWSLGRDGGTANPFGNVAYLKCRMDSHIIPAGWIDGGLTDKSTLRFWEYQSRDITGTSLVATNARAAWSSQLASADFDTASNPTNVFASVAWVPLLAPYVAVQPASQTAFIGQTATIAAAIGGIPEPVYQWYKGSTPVAGGTNYNLLIPSAQSGDSGTYSLRVTNDLDYVITSNAVLTVTTPVPPAFSNPIRLGNGNFQFSISGPPSLSYRVWSSADVTLRPITNTWTLLTSGAFSGSPTSFTDTNTGALPQRFYIITVP